MLPQQTSVVYMTKKKTTIIAQDKCQLVEDDISAVCIAPFSLPSSPSQSEDDQSSTSSTRARV